MKILYLTKGDHVDYQNDAVLIGLKELYGADIIDFNKQAHNYDTYPQDKASKLYGMGMTVTRVLPDLEVDRTDITSKIKNKYFNLIVYGSIWRCNDYIDKILEYYPTNKIVAIDGEDETNIHPVYNKGIPYFKRELVFNKPRMFPINFAIPTSKVNFNTNKVKNAAHITPLNKSTYIYKNEKDYYNDYNQARFGVTVKKAGWDCLRHYEILGNGCIPVFYNIDQCPDLTLKYFPKKKCSDVLKDLNSGEKPENVYEKHIDSFKAALYNNCTTVAVAKKTLDTLNSLA
jgi:hypothetical protein